MESEPLPVVVHVIDDDRDLRDSLEFLLRTKGFSVQTYASAAAFRQAPRPTCAGCILMDVRMPDLDGITALQQFLTAGLTTPIIIMTAYADIPLAVQAVKLGAVDFIEKPFDTTRLLRLIQQSIQVDQQQHLHAQQLLAFGERLHQLSDKQREVLRYLLEGAPNKTIALKLELTERAVEMRRSTLMRNLQVVTLAELVRAVTQYETWRDRRLYSAE